jgi:probable O-glycosylation ligase (exosortase A-associated)
VTSRIGFGIRADLRLRSSTVHDRNTAPVRVRRVRAGRQSERSGDAFRPGSGGASLMIRSSSSTTRSPSWCDAVIRLILVFGLILIGALASLQGSFYVLLFYFWNAYFRPDAWVWSDLVVGLRLSLTIGAFLILTSIKDLKYFKLTFQLILIVLFFAQATLSLFASDFFSSVWPFWVELLKIVIVCLVMTVLIRDRHQFRLTLWVICWSLSFELAKQGWAQLILNPGATNPNSNVLLGDNNGVALGCMMLVPLLMALAQTAPTPREKWIHRLVMLGVIYRGISTYSRGGFIAGGVVLLVTMLRSRYRLRVGVAAVVIGVTLYSVMPDRFWDRMRTISTSTEGDRRDASAASRLYFWQIATQMANDHPFTGVGINGFRYAFLTYDSGADEMKATHSIWFGVLADMGYPGLLLFAAVAIGALVSCQQSMRAARAAGQAEIATYAMQLQTVVLVYCAGGTFLSAQYLELWWHVVALSTTLSLILARDVGATTPAVAPVPQFAAMPVIPAKLER